MESLTRRQFLQMSGSVVGGVVLSGCRVEAAPRGEVNLCMNDVVYWDSRGTFGYSGRSRLVYKGPESGVGTVREICWYENFSEDNVRRVNCWVRVIYDPQRGGIAWHTAETLDKRVFDDQGQSLWTEVVVKRPGEE